MQPHAPRAVGPKTTNGHNKPDRTLSHGRPAEPLLRVLPIKRWIPQDVHSMLDYAAGVSVASGHFTTDDEAARWASVALGASVIGVSLLTDYRLSLVKLIPIRAHEALDYVWGASCIAAPFVLGYWKKSPLTAITHIAVGATTILGSLVTDYRSYQQQRDDERRRSQADLQPIMPT
ncbi:MAG TPA: hypothetical protein VFV99_30945 [Kofleriaceae bacterium]|nr:hypothetical protein [Kofleriaceae bacterium]